MRDIRPHLLNQSPSLPFARFAQRRPAVVALAFIALGIVLGQYAVMSHWLWLTLGSVALLALVALHQRTSLIVRGAILGFIALSLCAFRVGYQLEGNSPRHISRIVGNDQSYRIYGEISDWPDVREKRTFLTVDVDSTANDRDVIERSGAILIRIAVETHDFQYGDRVILTSTITKPPSRKNPGGFDYARYLRWNDIFGIAYLPHPFGISRNPQTEYSVGGLVHNIRHYILDVFRSTMESQQAELSAGFLIGETSGISDKLYNHFRNSGTLHLLAVSGSNVAIVLLALRLALWPFPLRRKTVYGILLVGAALFALVSQNEPSVVRASVMVSLFILGRMLERNIDLHNIIAAAGVIILLWNPNELFEVGFQLSFIVAWVIILYIEASHKLLGKRRRIWWNRWLLTPFIVAFVAQMAAAPLTLYYFGQAPVMSTFANLIISPLVSVAVALSMVTLAGSLIFQHLGLFLGSILNQWLKLVLLALDYFGGPGAPLWRSSFSEFGAGLSLAPVFLIGGSLTARRIRPYCAMALAAVPLFWFAPRALHSMIDQSSLWLYSTNSGIAALYVSEHADSEDALIIADLGHSVESEMQFLLMPQLRSHSSIDHLNIIGLSSDYPTLSAVFTLQDSCSDSRMYLPEKSRNVAKDYLARTKRRNSKAKPTYAGRVSESQEIFSDEESVIVQSESVASLRQGNALVVFLPVGVSSGEIQNLLINIDSNSTATYSVVCSKLNQRVFKAIRKNPILLGAEIYAQSIDPQFSANAVESLNLTVLSESGAVRLILPQVQ